MSYLFGGTPFDGYSRDGRRTVNGGDGGGGSSQPTQQTMVQTNIPDYAQPYVEGMLGTAQQQVYNMDASGNITGIKPYVPYSQNPADYVAPFSPLQLQAQQNAASLRVPTQFNLGSQMAYRGGMGTADTAGALGGYGGYAQSQMTNPYAQQAYMNPYLQNALQPSLEEMRRQYGITATQEAGRAAGAGAFGGTRQALMQAENERNKNIAMNKAIGEGYAQAFQQGQGAQQAALGMGLQGLQGAQSGYGQLGQLGTQLGGLGQQQLAAQQGVIGTQQQYGTMQQQQQQNIINQAIQNYAMQQQYPQQQLSYMSGLLRGLPMQQATTSSYQAAPSLTSQMTGLGALGLGAYGAMKRAGGTIRESDGLDDLGMYHAMKGEA